MNAKRIRALSWAIRTAMPFVVLVFLGCVAEYILAPAEGLTPAEAFVVLAVGWLVFDNADQKFRRPRK